MSSYLLGDGEPIKELSDSAMPLGLLSAWADLTAKGLMGALLLGGGDGRLARGEDSVVPRLVEDAVLGTSASSGGSFSVSTGVTLLCLSPLTIAFASAQSHAFGGRRKYRRPWIRQTGKGRWSRAAEYVPRWLMYCLSSMRGGKRNAMIRLILAAT